LLSFEKTRDAECLVEYLVRMMDKNGLDITIFLKVVYVYFDRIQIVAGARRRGENSTF